MNWFGSKKQHSENASSRLSKVVFYTGSSHPVLGDLVTSKLTYINRTGSAELSPANLGLVKNSPLIHDKFSNGERRVELRENVRGRHVFILQTGWTNSEDSINDYIMELLLMVNAAKLSDAKSITVILPYYPYSRQDKKDRSRTPISGRLLANMLEIAGVTRLVTMDLHSSQVQGFFNIPVDNLFARDLIIEYLQENVFVHAAINNFTKPDYIKDNFVLVSPDAGAAKKVMNMAQKLEINTVLMHKQRNHAKKNMVERTILIGEDDCVKGKTCIILDDMADTLGTVTKACDELVANGAKDVIVCVTHGILSGPALDRLNDCEAITMLITSNSVPQDSAKSKSKKVHTYDISGMLETCIKRIVDGGSISQLFADL